MHSPREFKDVALVRARATIVRVVIDVDPSAQRRDASVWTKAA